MKKFLTTAVFLLLLVLTPVLFYWGYADRPAADSANLESIAALNASRLGNAHAAETKTGDVIELDWDALVPAGYRPGELLEEYDYENLADDDPRAEELMVKLKELWAEAPLVREYEGKIVKLPGFVVPLQIDAKAVQEFLLVPYYGACIHVPPPPANQMVHVVTDKKRAFKGELFDAVWVTGRITVDRLSSDLGDAGYRIEATGIEPYE